MSDAVKFDETFSITSINSEKYDRVSRVYGTSTDSQTTFSLDINHELFPLSVGENVTICLADTLSLDGTKDDVKGWRAVAQGDSTLADMYEYVCHGKVYKFEDGGNESTVKMYASFGGLLLYVEGPSRKLTSCRIDNFYMLCKR
ncbi:DNA-directed RNA polymerases i, ii, and iii 145 kDa polypeptide [Polyplosphaeria fusca]|uniref:DNA-directed RNA polymerases I, II, and III subunit RPABC3 n=1 Tax=Polyplosphaeria fusca TaxID=682080 RepID=A0A9P4R9P6_9PLEO|nr:DNA-directed RNA polymerases i, ii, and iii 145 kDa polypeptide [Polyplosphaeria fusca]